MRVFLTIMLCAAAGVGTATAQSQKYGPAQRYEGPLGAPLEAPAPQPVQAPPGPGYYAAPPAAGTFAGPARSVGIEGLAIHIPAMSLRFPTLELPSFFSTRRQPKVMLDTAHAPFVQQQQPVGVGAPLAVQAVVPAEVPPPAAPEAPAAPERPSAPMQKDDWYQKSVSIEDTRDREIAELRQQVATLAASLERLTQLTEVAARGRSDVDRMSYHQAVESGYLQPPTRSPGLPQPATYRETAPLDNPMTGVRRVDDGPGRSRRAPFLAPQPTPYVGTLGAGGQ